MHLAALAAAKGCGWKWHENLWSGIIHVKDELYFTESPEGSPLGQSRTALLEAYQQLGVLATEMEFSVLTILADLMNRREEKRHIDVGCIDLVASNYHDLHAAKSPSSPTVTFEHLDPNAAIEVALKTLQLKSCWDRGTELRQIDAVLHEI
jgi:uridine phosphorylase